MLFLTDHTLHLIPAQADALLFGKDHVGLGRVVATLVVLGFGFLLTATLWQQLERWLGWFVMPLGRNSLRCYVVHVPAVYGAAILLHLGSPPGLGARIENTLLQVAALISIWLVVGSAAPRRTVCAPALPATAPLAVRASRAVMLTLFRLS